MLFLTNAAGLLLYSLLALRFHWGLLLLLALGAGGQLLLQQRSRRYEQSCRDAYTPLDQKLRYLESRAAAPISGKEIRLYQMAGLFERLYRRYLEERIKWSKKVELRQFFTDAASGAARFLCNGLGYLYLAWAALQGRLSAADFALYFGLVGGYSAWMAGVLEYCHQLGRIHLQFQELLDFLNRKDRETGGSPVPRAGAPSVALEHVCFRYPGSEKDTLHDVCLTIAPGEKLAVVGENGAGKTTLIKLLCGLYRPTSGRVLLNGEDITRFDRDSYFTLFSVVFQDVKVLPTSIAKNVAMGTAEPDTGKVRRCLELAGLWEKVERLPEGMDALLCPAVYPQAVSLSGGETQRLALARALYQDGDILLLDEPTAALDPRAEEEVYTHFDRLTGGRTAVYISHRLSSCRFCDRIAVMEAGRIVECGSHEALLEQGGAYARLWKLQARQYVETV